MAGGEIFGLVDFLSNRVLCRIRAGANRDFSCGLDSVIW